MDWLDSLRARMEKREQQAKQRAAAVDRLARDDPRWVAQDHLWLTGAAAGAVAGLLTVVAIGVTSESSTGH